MAYGLAALVLIGIVTAHGYSIPGALNHFGVVTLRDVYYYRL
jgi:hypothetical protein